MTKVVTFGCRLNSYESEVIKAKIQKAGLNDDVAVFNTCSVTKEAEKEAIRSIKKFKKHNPNSKIVVTGCAAQINPNTFAEMESVSFVFGNVEKLTDTPYNIIKNGLKSNNEAVNSSHTRHEDKIFFNSRAKTQEHHDKILVNDIMSIKQTYFSNVVSSFENKTRAFLEIQNGCNHRCTFCIIPFARGNSRSVPFGILAQEIQKLVNNGYQEVVLTGVDITDYGKDLPGGLTLGKMVKRLLNHIPNLPRLRLSSVDVAEIDEDIFYLLRHEPRFMPYFHISLQSGDNLILKRMKRRHSREDVLNFVQKVREIRSDAAFGADIISGFPTETKDQFLNSKNLIIEAGISFCHIFSFSPHDGTPAAKMPQIEKSIIKQRTKELIEEGKNELKKLLNSMIEKEFFVLCESNTLARCHNFATGVITNATQDFSGQIVRVKAVGVKDEKLIFELIN